MSGTVPPPPPPPGGPSYEPYGGAGDEPRAPTAPTQEQSAVAPQAYGQAAQPNGAAPGQHAPVPPAPAAHQPAPYAPAPPVQRVSTSTRMPPAISPGAQFAQAVTPAPARPGQPVVHSVQGHGHNHAGQPQGQPPQDASLQQYFPEQYGDQQGYPPAQYPPAAPYAPQGYAGQYDQGQPAQYAPGQYDPQYAAQPAYAGGAGGGGGRGGLMSRLTPGWIAFIAFDIALVVAAVIFAVSLFGEDEPEDASPGSSVSASATPDAPAGPAADAVTFKSPTGNITCSVTPDAARCGIATLNNQPVPAESCDGTIGYVVTVDDAGQVAQPCVAHADQPVKASPDIPSLEYGQEQKAHGFTCTSSDVGMKCVSDATGTGFSIAKAGIGAA
ncbi:hypothetical protein [Antribacter gilvus]|uniref:hypothetical protein n=1 Tax=Antribacter gilvus TaxID=2304675 RepID=UPI000F7784DE|nr:hypothetical protein [Antribacter gilvus]